MEHRTLQCCDGSDGQQDQQIGRIIVVSTKNYSVEGMTCDDCVASVEEEVSEVLGTQGAEVDLETGRVAVTGEGFSDEDIIAAVERAGYQVKQ